MEENNKTKKSPVTFREVISDWGVGCFFGFYIAYTILGRDVVKADLIDAFGVRFFAVTKGGVLLASIGSTIIGGYRLFKIFLRLKKTIKIVDISNDEK